MVYPPDQLLRSDPSIRIQVALEHLQHYLGENIGNDQAFSIPYRINDNLVDLLKMLDTQM